MAMNSTIGMDFAALFRLTLLVLLMVVLPLGYVWWRTRRAGPQSRLAVLLAVTLFLTFDLIVFGAFTRLSDSGLGCPDWPGCYGSASPVGAQMDIHAAQTAAPSGPVTTQKAWIEMIHRYLAMTVGALIAAMTVMAWNQRGRNRLSPWWPTLTLVWVLAQGMFGKYTVTLKLYPAIVTLHLLGGLILLAVLVWQREMFQTRRLPCPSGLRALLVLSLALVAVQVSLGAWVSSNYAVLACSGFPQCNGAWWPEMDLGRGFSVFQGLGETGAQGYMTLPALVAIHMTHRLFAIVVVSGLLLTSWHLMRSSDSSLKRKGKVLALLTLAQPATGLSTVILGWPMLAALAHSAGAAGLVFVLSSLLASTQVKSRKSNQQVKPISVTA